MMSYQDYCFLAQELHHAAIAYFHQDISVMSDPLYDQLYRNLIECEKQHPDWIVSYSPSQRVGSLENSLFEKALHQQFMGSLENVFQPQEYKKWIESCEKNLGISSIEVIAEPKIDGLAVSLHYKQGLLVEAITRGDGFMGEKVLKQVQTISSIPLALKDPSFNGEIRGEVYFKTRDFLALNIQQEQKGLHIFANPRNAAAGSLRQLDWTICAQRPLSFLPYTVFGLKDCHTQQDVLLWVKTQGFEVTSLVQIVHSVSEALAIFEEFCKNRSQIPFGIDGVVFKIMHFAQQQILGSTNRTPRWAIAWKFPADQKITTLLAIDYQVGRLGSITPVAICEPISIDGVTVQSATLHNFREIERKGLKIRQKVWLRRAGDVIPEILGPVNTEILMGDSIIPPQICPSCYTSLEEIDEILHCPAGYNCPDQKIQRLTYALSQDALNVPGLSSQSIKKAVSAGLIHTPSQIFALSQDQWQSLEGIGPKLAANFSQNLKAALNTTPSRFLLAFSIRHVGKTTANQIFSTYSWDSFLLASQDDLLKYPNIGPITALALCSFKESAFFRSEYQAFMNLGLFFKTEIPQEGSQRLRGISIVVTGSFSFFSREQWQNWILSHGGTWESSITKKTNCVIAGEAAGSKKQKALEKKILIIEKDQAEYLIDRVDASDKEAAACLRLLTISPA